MDSQQTREDWPMAKILTTVAAALLTAAIGWSAATTVQLGKDVAVLSEQMRSMNHSIAKIEAKLERSNGLTRPY